MRNRKNKREIENSKRQRWRSNDNLHTPNTSSTINKSWPQTYYWKKHVIVQSCTSIILHNSKHQEINNCCVFGGDKYRENLYQWIMNNHISEFDTTHQLKTLRVVYGYYLHLYDVQFYHSYTIWYFTSHLYSNNFSLKCESLSRNNFSLE